MKNLKIKTLILGLSLIVFACGSNENDEINQNLDEAETTDSIAIIDTSETMKLGAFSVSLSVKDLTVSKEFYESFGFKIIGGGMEQNYLIMQNEHSIIGLFQGMFEGNILTFNPGWDENGKNIDQFDDIRTIQAHLKNKKINIGDEINPDSKGPASLMITDPDGNVILIDQHR